MRKKKVKNGFHSKADIIERVADLAFDPKDPDSDEYAVQLFLEKILNLEESYSLSDLENKLFDLWDSLEMNKDTALITVDFPLNLVHKLYGLAIAWDMTIDEVMNIILREELDKERINE